MAAQPETLTDISRDEGNGDTLRRRLMLWLGGASIVLVSMLSWVSYSWVRQSLRSQVEVRLQDAATRSAALVDRMLADRERTVVMLTSSPAMVDAAQVGNARAEDEHLPRLSMEQLEEKFNKYRSLEVSSRAKDYLRSMLVPSDIAEVIMTNENGYNAVTTGLTSDFVQSDEAWWQDAVAVSVTQPEASFDESAGAVSISLGGAVRARKSDRPVGVIKVVFGVRELDSELARAAERSGVEVSLLDEKGGILAGSTKGERLKPIPGLTVTGDEDSDVRQFVNAQSLREWASVVPAAGGRWHVVAHLPENIALAALVDARMAIMLGSLGLVGLMLFALFLVGRMVQRRVSEPAAELAIAAEKVASGDLSLRLGSLENDEIGRLTRATGEMVSELRHLVSTIRDSANETSAMSSQITAGSEEMSAAASEMAHTSSELSEQSAEMARTIVETADAASNLQQIADRNTGEAHAGVERNAKLRQLARENRERMDESARALEVLATEAQRTAAASDSLADASEQIRAFVSLVRKIARQSKLLALNASMEAARAGVQGEGFAVVASEIRKLATNSNDAAEKTEALVNAVLQRVEESRESSKRTVSTVAGVRKATREAGDSFAQVERAVVESERWVESLEKSATESSSLVTDITHRLDSLARGTETFAAAMQEVAAGSEEQSASTEEIAAAASALAESSRQLSRLVAAFRLDSSSEGRAENGAPMTRQAPHSRDELVVPAGAAMPAITVA
jgi:methyl-accepting chemotaxis protein